MVEEIEGLEMDYTDTTDHARDNALGEGANKIVEAAIQSIL